MHIFHECVFGLECTFVISAQSISHQITTVIDA